MNRSSFGRKRDQKDLLIRNLATSVILYESVVTTEAKARAVQPVVDRLIHLGLAEDRLSARRALLGYLPDQNAVNKIMGELVTRFEGRTSGYTRRYRLPARKGDGSPQALIQLTKTVLLPDAVANPAAEDKPKRAKASATKTETDEVSNV